MNVDVIVDVVRATALNLLLCFWMFVRMIVSCHAIMCPLSVGPKSCPVHLKVFLQLGAFYSQACVLLSSILCFIAFYDKDTVSSFGVLPMAGGLRRA